MRAMRYIVLFVLLVAWGPSMYAGVIEDSVVAGNAFFRGDYRKAFNLYKKLAEDGQAPERFYLAEMLRKGQGTNKNAKEAEKWYAKAREQGVSTRLDADKASGARSRIWGQELADDQKNYAYEAQKKENDIKRQNELERIALAEKEEHFKDTPEYYQQKAIARITDAKFRIAAAEKAIAYENRIGDRTGYVNKSRIYEAGSYLIAYEDVLKQAYKDYKSAGGKLPLSKIK